MALYVNLKEKNYSWQVVDDFRSLSRQLGGNSKIEEKRKNKEKENFRRDSNGKIINTAPVDFTGAD